MFVSIIHKLTHLVMKKQKIGIKRFLRKGDPAILSEMTGYSVRAVRAMLSGERSMNLLVEEAAHKLIERRRKIADERLEDNVKTTKS